VGRSVRHGLHRLTPQKRGELPNPTRPTIFSGTIGRWLQFTEPPNTYTGNVNTLPLDKNKEKEENTYPITVGIFGNLKNRISGAPDFSQMPRKELLREMPEYLTVEQSISMLLLLEDEKPGVLLMGANEDQRALVKSFCRKFDCSKMEVEGYSNPGVFITRNPDRFKIIKNSSGDFYGASDSAVGKFLGYEKKAREYYQETMENDKLAREKFEEKLAELERKGEVPQGYENYLELISYIPYPDRKHITQAIQRGRKRYNLLENNSIGKELLRELEQETDGKDPVVSGL
jgi:hypothetical protein